MERQSRQEIKKHVATIHCANTLSLLQRKISNALLYHAYPNLLDREEHQITISRLCNIIGYSGHNHAAIKEALRGMIATIVEWNVIDDKTKEEDWTASSIIASVNIKGPICSYAYSPRMRRLLHSPAIYGKINLIIQSRFKSNYGLALYENCVRYKGLLSTKWFDYAIFRKLMGVPDNKYLVFRDFKKRVLDKSVEEVNAHSDIIVEPEIKRHGWQVQHIRFLLKERPKRQRIGNLLEKTEGQMEASNDLMNQLVTKFQFTHRQAQYVIAQYPSEYIQEKINLVQLSSSYQQQQINNIAAYLMTALKQDYQSHQTPVKGEIKAKNQSRQNDDAVQQIKVYIDEQKLRKKAKDYFDKLNDSEQQAILANFHNQLIQANDILAIKWYEKHGLEHRGVFAIFIHFLKNEQLISLTEDDMHD